MLYLLRKHRAECAAYKRVANGRFSTAGWEVLGGEKTAGGGGWQTGRQRRVRIGCSLLVRKSLRAGNKGSR